MSGKSLQQQIVELNNRKIDKSASQGLSDNNFTNTYKDKVDDSFQKSGDTLDDITAGTTNRHFTETEKTKLGSIASNADVTSAAVGPAIWNSTADATPNDGDRYALANDPDQEIRHTTWSNIKATLKTYFDGLYAALIVNSWTPTLGLTNCSLATVSNQQYIKIGKLCYLSFQVNATLTSTGSEVRVSFTLPANARANITRDVGAVYHNLTTDISNRGIGIVIDLTDSNNTQGVVIIPASQVQRAAGVSFLLHASYTYITE